MKQKNTSNESLDDHFSVVDKRFWNNESEESPGAKEESANESADSKKPAYVVTLENELKESKQRLEDYIASYRKYKEETELFQKRLERDIDKKVTQLQSNFLGKLLRVFQTLERSLKTPANETNCDEFRKGMELLVSQFYGILKDHGVKKIETTGKEFDPEHAEALDIIPTTDESKDNIIAEESEVGYTYNNTVVLPAKVKVYKFLDK